MDTKDIHDKIINNLSSIYTLNKIIFDSEGLPIDYKLLDTNSVFEEKLNLKSEESIGSLMSEWIFKDREIREEWYGKFAKLVQSGGRKEFKEILEYNGSYYVIIAFPPGPGYLVVFFYEAMRYRESSKDLKEIRTAAEISQALSESFFMNTPMAIVIYEVKGKGQTSMDYIIRRVNPAGLIIEDWDLNYVTGQALGVVRPGVEDFGIIDSFKKVWDTGNPIFFPARVYREDGEKRWFENSIFKLPTGEIVAVYDDVTEKKEAENALFAEKEKLKVTLYSIGDGVITTDKYGNVEILNNVSEELTGWKQEEARGKPLSSVFEIYNERTGDICENPGELVLQHGNIVGLANHTVLKSRDGSLRAISDSAAPIRNEDGEILGVVLVFRDETEAREKEERIKYLSYRDSLTGLYNRAYFEDKLENDLDSKEHLPLTFIMGDVDGLKLVNDIYSHTVGDQVLKKIGDVFTNLCREHDMIARWGGDEFVVLLPNTSLDIGENICKRIKEASESLSIMDTKVSISLGYATKYREEENWQDVLMKAEDNMYKSKLLGAKSYRSTVLASMKNALFEKSSETKEHAERLSHFSMRIGVTMGLTPVEIDELQLLAMLHDIGKIAIDDNIIDKPGPLTEQEWEVMKKHPEIGFRIAQTVPELVNIAEYILAHHERWDGKGYPRGLKGENIPILARILSVVDAYDAMTQDRPYRKARSPEFAREELISNAGTQFDPEIVKIFIKYLDN